MLRMNPGEAFRMQLPGDKDSHSVSTEESPRQQVSAKEKSQLCKKFIENGCCPYKNRCKFAHGLHELKKNQQANCKYKTKLCGVFLQEGACTYGNRCNFIHPPPHPSPCPTLAPDMQLLRAQGRATSKLLALLGCR